MSFDLLKYSVVKCALIGILFFSSAIADESLMQITSREIVSEAALPSISQYGRPLPLVGHWNKGQLKGGFNAKYQLELIGKGHHLLPWFNFPVSEEKWDHEHYEVIPILKKHNLPISFVGTQWERVLSENSEFINLEEEINPNFVGLSGKIDLKVSPFGRESDWHSAGMQWTDRVGFEKLQEYYQNPPLVLFVSNNEHHKMRWHEAYLSKRFLSEYSLTTSFENVRNIVGNKWIKLYGALFDGMTNGLKEAGWKNNLRYVGYGAFSPSAIGRWPGWIKYSLNTTDRVEPWSSVWGGASVSYYLHDWNQITDFTVMSPQVEAMNWVFVLDEAQKNNPNYWFELSVWDGNQPDKKTDKRKYYNSIGQDFNEVRYGGYVRFGMWLLRPRLVREFRGWSDTVARNEQYFMSIVGAVDEIYKNETLERFWRFGELVENAAESHPYQTMLSDEIAKKSRWYMLTSDINPPRPWRLDSELKVYAIALKLQKDDKKEYLIYAYSPVENIKNISVDLPGYGKIIIDASTSGVFSHLNAADNKITKIEN